MGAPILFFTADVIAEASASASALVTLRPTLYDRFVATTRSAEESCLENCAGGLVASEHPHSAIVHAHHNMVATFMAHTPPKRGEYTAKLIALSLIGSIRWLGSPSAAL